VRHDSECSGHDFSPELMLGFTERVEVPFGVAETLLGFDGRRVTAAGDIDPVGRERQESLVCLLAIHDGATLEAFAQ